MGFKLVETPKSRGLQYIHLTEICKYFFMSKAYQHYFYNVFINVNSSDIIQNITRRQNFNIVCSTPFFLVINFYHHVHIRQLAFVTVSLVVMTTR